MVAGTHLEIVDAGRENTRVDRHALEGPPAAILRTNMISTLMKLSMIIRNQVNESLAGATRKL